MKTKRIITMIVVLALLCTAIPVMAAFSDANEPEVTVRVIVNEYDEEYIKNLTFDDGTKIGDYEYSIEYVEHLTRDPNYMATYFNSAMWATREDGITLMLDPKYDVRNTIAGRDSAWTILAGDATGLGGDPNWPTADANVKTFRWQYDCHFDFAKGKDTWNIEPWRTAGSYASVCLQLCNP